MKLFRIGKKKQSTPTVRKVTTQEKPQALATMLRDLRIVVERVHDHLAEMPIDSWHVVAEVDGREGVYGVEEVSAHTILAELAGRGVFLVSPWRDVAIDVAAKLNGQPPDVPMGDPVEGPPPEGGDSS